MPNITREYTFEQFAIVNPKFAKQYQVLIDNTLKSVGLPPVDCPDPDLQKVYSKVYITETGDEQLGKIYPLYRYFLGPITTQQYSMSVHCRGVYGENNNLVSACAACPNKRLMSK